MDDRDRELYERAVKISNRAYAPYSNFLVGAVLRARDGTIFEGVNVENGAYPLGVCGEKSAYVAAVTAGYKPGDFDLLVINASPCGGCRQWHVEFGVDRVVYANNEGELVEYTPAELLPDSFSSDREVGFRRGRRAAERRQVHARQRALRRQGDDRLRQAADDPAADLRDRERRRLPARARRPARLPAAARRAHRADAAHRRLGRSTTSTPCCSSSTAARTSAPATASSPSGSSRSACRS